MENKDCNCSFEQVSDNNPTKAIGHTRQFMNARIGDTLMRNGLESVGFVPTVLLTTCRKSLDGSNFTMTMLAGSGSRSFSGRCGDAFKQNTRDSSHQ